MLRRSTPRSPTRFGTFVVTRPQARAVGTRLLGGRGRRRGMLGSLGRSQRNQRLGLGRVRHRRATPRCTRFRLGSRSQRLGSLLARGRRCQLQSARLGRAFELECAQALGRCSATVRRLRTPGANGGWLDRRLRYRTRLRARRRRLYTRGQGARGRVPSGRWRRSRRRGPGRAECRCWRRDVPHHRILGGVFARRIRRGERRRRRAPRRNLCRHRTRSRARRQRVSRVRGFRRLCVRGRGDLVFSEQLPDRVFLERKIGHRQLGDHRVGEQSLQIRRWIALRFVGTGFPASPVEPLRRWLFLVRRRCVVGQSYDSRCVQFCRNITRTSPQRQTAVVSTSYALMSHRAGAALPLVGTQT